MLDYGDLTWAPTGERITAESFPRLRAAGGRVVCHQIQEADIVAALQHPAVSIASDGHIGVYLKRVGGPVLASLQGDRVFEPASTIK
jgi:beta-lactamase class A